MDATALEPTYFWRMHLPSDPWLAACCQAEAICKALQTLCEDARAIGALHA
jgi:hypothetical protein